MEVPSPALLEVLSWSRADGGEGAADVADVVIAGLDAEMVSRCLGLLPEPQRVCIVLVDVTGYTARGGGGGPRVPAGHGAGPGAPGPALLAQLLAQGGGGAWTVMTAMTGC